jgi:signal transduction histidine kinase
MKELLKIFCSYFKSNIIIFVVGVISSLIFLVVFSLYSLPLEPVIYAMCLSVFFSSIVVIFKFIKFYNKHMMLRNLKENTAEVENEIMFSNNLIENDYVELIKIINKDLSDLINEKNRAYADMMDYYTMWAHQIKTPIAAMRLILQTNKTEKNTELLEQLFKIEQYVEMVLQFLRMESMSSDLMFKKYPLDDIIKQAIRKYSKSFIYKKIKLNYKNVNQEVLTDEKWLVFVIEQILSNALKYTFSGEISIYMDEKSHMKLVIEDTGMGISHEDLPRVFEKGFTGYNGRLDKKSTGIGLYLCKQILNKLSHTISIESEVEKGTKVKIDLSVMDILKE